MLARATYSSTERRFPVCRALSGSDCAGRVPFLIGSRKERPRRAGHAGERSRTRPVAPTRGAEARAASRAQPLPRPRSLRVRDAAGSRHGGALAPRRGRPARPGARQPAARGPRRPAGDAEARLHLPRAQPPDRGGTRSGALRERARASLRGDQAPAAGHQPGGDRPLPARRPAGTLRAPRALVRRPRQPPRRAHLPWIARRRARDRADPRHRLRPARPRRPLSGALRARHREGEGRPPQAHGRGASEALQGPPVSAPPAGRPARGGQGLRGQAARLPARSRGGADRRGRGRRHAGERPRGRSARSSTRSSASTRPACSSGSESGA